MSGSLRDDLASLKIDRSGKSEVRSGSRKPKPRPEPLESGFELAARPRRVGPSIGGILLTLLLWLIPLSLLAVGGYYGWTQYETIRSRPVVSTTVVQAMTSGEASKLLTAKGYLKSRNQAMIGAKVPGRVEQLFIEEGMKVKRGQVLAILEHNDLDAQLATRNSMIERARAELLEAEADYDEKRRKAARAERLAVRGTVSSEESEDARAALLKTEARKAALEASIKYQQAMVRETHEALKNMEIVAPFDGTIVRKDSEIGEMITGGGMGSGLSIGRSAVATLANLDRMDVETDISENMLARIGIGQPAEISVSAVPEKRYRGRLRQIIPISDRARGTVKVMVEFLEPDEHLFPELVATVHFLPDKDVKSLDNGAIQRFVLESALFEENGRTCVWVVDAKDRIHKREVEVVVTTDDKARVEAGLDAGELVVDKPTPNLRENEIVKKAE
ncbi:MAG: efflux RND transporter periplasmic adaptor subunit [Isosphaeraceae bacterium]|nr:efflux RND transporter periplasmic adaptor subunit [Isosphaeraceae bacterium]